MILGTGNVSWHLSRAFFKAEIDVCQIVGRTLKAAEEVANPIQAEAIIDFTKIDKHADLYLICVNDRSIAEVANQMPQVKGIIAHTSGAVPLLELKNTTKYGVFYPLQTLTKGVEINFLQLPILVEANAETVTKELLNIAKEISNQTFSISTAQREKLHVAAVFVNNFTNHLFAQAYQFCQENQLPFETLHALILETARKATLGNPAENQTGPAARGDETTIQKHLNQLTNAEQKELYKLLTKSIKKA